MVTYVSRKSRSGRVRLGRLLAAGGLKQRFTQVCLLLLLLLFAKYIVVDEADTLPWYVWRSAAMY